MVIVGQDSTMYECRVLYIGSAPPVETLKGIDALQGPLQKRYPANLDDVNGIDAVVRVLPTHLEVKYLESGEIVEFPLEKLTICAGVRAVNVIDGSTGDTVRQFVPVNNVQQPDSSHPAIFAAIIRRNKGRQIAECHMFICNSTRDALHLVNAAATANMALKNQNAQVQESTTTINRNDVIVVKTDVVNGYANGGHVADDVHVQSYRTEPIRIDSGVRDGPKRFQIQQPKTEAVEPETIYITFDKSNLVAKGEDTMQLKSRQTRRTEYREPMYIESPRPVQNLRPVPVPVVQAPRLRYVSAPPPPRLMMVQRPVMVQPPPPPPMMVRPPPPQRMYTKRVVAPPPQPRYVAPAPTYVRSRARSASPVGRSGAFQPKWQGNSRTKSDFAGPRQSRRDQNQYFQPQPTLEFFQQTGDPRAMHLSQRMHADNRIMRDHSYHYPTAYELHEAMNYDRPTTKSNPRYSSSSSDSDLGKNDRIRRFKR